MAVPQLPSPALVRPARRPEGTGRSALALGGAAVLLVAVCAVVGSSSGRTSSLIARIGTVEFVLMEGMPDPAEAVNSATMSVSQVHSFHSDGVAAAAQAEAAGEDDIPKMITSPKYATTLGREAATHALSQPFNVPLEKAGQEVAGDVAPDGEYAPITPAYSNPLARFIPNVTYYEVGVMGPGTRQGGHSHRFFNAFAVNDEDDDDEGEEEEGNDDEAEGSGTEGGREMKEAVEEASIKAADKEGEEGREEAVEQAESHAELKEDSSSYLSALSRLYASLAGQESTMQMTQRKQAAIRAAIGRITRASEEQSRGAMGGIYMPVAKRVPAFVPHSAIAGRMITISPTGPAQ